MQRPPTLAAALAPSAAGEWIPARVHFLRYRLRLRPAPLLRVFSYNLGVAIFGGLTPTVALWLTNSTGQAKAPSYWVMFAAALSIGALWTCWKKYRIK